MTDQRASAREMSELIRKKYSISAQQSEEDRYIDAAMKLITLIQEEKNQNYMLSEAARAIHRVFGFNEVTIGLRSPEDGKYRYEAIIGHTRDAEKALRSFVYTRDQMTDCGEFPGVPVSKYTEFNLREYETHKIGVEEKAYSRPLALREQRPSAEDMIEGDYLDVYIFAEKDNMIGWVELSHKRDDKFPSRVALKWLELFAGIIGLGIKNIELLRNRRNA